MAKITLPPGPEQIADYNPAADYPTLPELMDALLAERTGGAAGKKAMDTLLARVEEAQKSRRGREQRLARAMAATNGGVAG